MTPAPEPPGNEHRATGVLSEVEALDQAQTLKALAYPIRQCVPGFFRQYGGEISVTGLVACLPLQHSTIEHHLAILRRAGLVSRQFKSSRAYGTLRKEALRQMQERIDALFPVVANQGEP